MDVACKKCQSLVLKSYGSVMKLRSRIVLFEDDRTMAKCVNCGNLVNVPLEIKKSFTAVVHYIPHEIKK